MKLVSIIIPTNKSFHIWRPLLYCIAQQSYPEIEVVLCIDRQITGREFDQMSSIVHDILDPAWVQVRLISSYNTTFIPWKGASYVRNYWVNVAQWMYVQYMDDDGLRESDYMMRMVDRYESIRCELWLGFIASPTIMYRDTGQIQSQWFDRVWRGICRPQPHHATEWKASIMSKVIGYRAKVIEKKPIPYDIWPMTFWVSCIGAMWLFAPRELLQVITFDERFEFVYEDLDMTLRASRAWIPVIVFSDISVQHMETPRTAAQRSYVWSPQMVYYKSRNRIFFVSNNAPWRGKALFYLMWFPLHLIRFTVLIWLYGSDKLQSWWMLWKGTWDWVRTKGKS